MTDRQLAEALRDMWFSAEEGARTPMLHLFGIRYAEYLKGWKIRELGDLSELAGLKASYGTELQKMVKQAPFVRER